MDRRSFLRAGLAAMATTASAAKKRYRAAVIGHTGRGNYGHGLDTVWAAFDFIDVVAVADADDAGRGKALKRLGVKKAYRDYREMLRQEKPDLVSIGPRWLEQRVEMVTAAAEAGAHIYLEKPFAPDLVQADQMVEVVERNKIKLQLAHQMRRSPFAQEVHDILESGEIGAIQEVRGRGKEDRRAGGEDLVVLGSHICDLMRMLVGDPRWVFAHVTHDGEELKRRHRRTPTEPIGPIAGNQIAAMFAFDHGVHGYFGSKVNDQTHPKRFGIHIYGSKGVIYLPNAIYPAGQPYVLRSPAWIPDEKHQWEKIEPGPDISEVGDIRGEGRQVANALMVLDLLEAIEKDREPACGARDGRWSIEMIASIYQSQKTGGRVNFPLQDRRHPLETL